MQQSKRTQPTNTNELSDAPPLDLSLELSLLPNYDKQLLNMHSRFTLKFHCILQMDINLISSIRHVTFRLLQKTIRWLGMASLVSTLLPLIDSVDYHHNYCHYHQL